MSFYVQPKQIMLANFLFPIIQKYKQSQDLICYDFYNVGNSYKNITRIFHGISYSVKFSHSLVSDSPRPHGLQHSRLPCPSPTPGKSMLQNQLGLPLSPGGPTGWRYFSWSECSSPGSADPLEPWPVLLTEVWDFKASGRDLSCLISPIWCVPAETGHSAHE